MECGPCWSTSPPQVSLRFLLSDTMHTHPANVPKVSPWEGPQHFIWLHTPQWAKLCCAMMCLPFYVNTFYQQSLCQHKRLAPLLKVRLPHYPDLSRIKLRRLNELHLIPNANGLNQPTTSWIHYVCSVTEGVLFSCDHVRVSRACWFICCETSSRLKRLIVRHLLVIKAPRGAEADPKSVILFVWWHEITILYYTLSYYTVNINWEIFPNQWTVCEKGLINATMLFHKQKISSDVKERTYEC